MREILRFVKQAVQIAVSRDRFRLRLNHLPKHLAPERAWTNANVIENDHDLIRRLSASYKLACTSFQTDGESMWYDFFSDMHGDINKSILENDLAKVQALLNDPASSDIFFGFDAVAKTNIRGAFVKPDYLFGDHLVIDGLLRLAEAVGARHLANPERNISRMKRITADEIIDSLEEFFGFAVSVPNLFRKEFGIASKRGIISYRVPQAIYQAWYMAQLVAGIPNPRVLEIGGGLGRTGFYAKAFGITDYTIVDIPITSLAQGYYLARTLGNSEVVLFGEQKIEADKKVKLITPAEFLNTSDKYDIIINVDSLTEMDEVIAKDYVDAILNRTGVFVSINHEANSFTVRDLMAKKGELGQMTRTPYWLREGYVHEVWQKSD